MDAGCDIYRDFLNFLNYTLSVFLKQNWSFVSYSRRGQSIKIGTDLLIDQSIKIGKFNLIFLN